MTSFAFASEQHTHEDVFREMLSYPPTYSLKSDEWIQRQATINGMIAPCVPKLIREEVLGDVLSHSTRKVISYGLSSYGYDIRLSPKDFRIFRHIPGTVVNPKRFNPENVEPAMLHSDEDGQFFVLPGHTYGLGVALEHLSIPDNVTVLCIGKSTYARCGIIANLSPGEAGWCGHLTLEFSNSSSADCRIYANEGVVQLIFFEGEPCKTSYQTRQGKYQNQGHEITLAKV
jgi:dCTP deaminase